MNQFCKIFYCCSMAAITTPANAQYLNSNTANNTPQFPAKDSIGFVHIHQVRVTGNSKTKEFIILRELKLKQGDSIKNSDLDNELNISRQQVYNTTLFNSVNISAIPASAGEIDIEVKVKERWYIYPIPQFQLVDRNFNEWYVKYKADLSRVTYGIKFTHYNLTGSRDQLSIYLLNGFTRNLSFSYSQPFTNKALTRGFGFAGGLLQSRQINYATSFHNKLLAFNNGDFSGTSFFASVGYIIRRAIRERHIFSIAYTHIKVADSVVTALYNPNYFKTSRSSLGYPELSYTYLYTDVDNVAYPLKGKTVFATALKRGFGIKAGINMFSLEAGYNKYWDMKKRWYGSVQLSGKIKLPFDQAYINQRAMGYGDTYLRGLEYYVIDGAAYGLARSTLKKKLFSFSIPFTFRSKQLKIPFAIFAKTFADLGYSYNKKKYGTYLNNRVLCTSGFGIDILTVYDVNFRIEYSFNQLNENGLFLHARGGF